MKQILSLRFRKPDTFLRVFSLTFVPQEHRRVIGPEAH